LQKRTTAFVTLPIAALAVASIGIVLASLLIGANEADKIALARQRQTIENALDQYGLSLARELRVQTVWSEAYEQTRARDAAWMQDFYGEYLHKLLGYDRIYVLAEDDAPVFSYVAPDQPAAGGAELAPDLADLLKAVRHPLEMPADYDIVTTDIPLSTSVVAHHVSVADTRSIGGRPATVVVSTIVPDHRHPESASQPPMLLVAVEDIDHSFTQRLGENFGFRDLRWDMSKTPKGDTSEVVKALNGSEVGTLVWHQERPGLEFIKRVAPGLGMALLLTGAVAILLILWGNRQAQQLLESERHATQAARTDALTGLPNRVALREVFARLLDEAKGGASNMAVLSIDIDQFKAINDAFGHAIGDAVLVVAGKRLRGLIAPGGFLARPDGDSFVMLAPGARDDAAAELASDVITALAEPFDLDGGTRVFITASVGYAVGPRDGHSSDELLRRAELAVDKAKAEGGETAVAFVPEMDAEVTYRRMLEMALRKVVADGAISVVYQPLMDPSGSRVLGVEALARWTDPELGPVSPEIFIPLAEETGLIQNIGEHVLHRAVEDAKAWHGVSVAVNVSASQIHHGDVVAVVRDVLASSGFPAERLEIEITESVLLADEKRANEQMRGLQALGVKVALDDFGTGYSGLQYLRRFGFDKLKIDRSFIDGAGEPLDSSIVLASIIKLGQDLDLTITAEGVETPEQQRWLQVSGCHQLQGYLFSRPLTAEQMTQFIKARASRAVAS
jgi:diguanylate cyclase (GGDEF)-like protein